MFISQNNIPTSINHALLDNLSVGNTSKRWVHSHVLKWREKIITSITVLRKPLYFSGVTSWTAAKPHFLIIISRMTVTCIYSDSGLHYELAKKRPLEGWVHTKHLSKLSKSSHAFDLKWCLETDDHEMTPSTTSESKLWRSSFCKQDTNTFTKPRTACKISMKSLMSHANGWKNLFR